MNMLMHLPLQQLVDYCKARIGSPVAVGALIIAFAGLFIGCANTKTKSSAPAQTQQVSLNDRGMRNIVAALGKQQSGTLVASRYRVTEQTVPTTPGKFLDRGILFAMKGEYDKAIADFSEALKLDPNLNAAYQLRGRALYASVSYVTDLDENFSGVGSLSKGGQVSLEEQRVYDQAIADYNQAISLNPKFAGAYTNRGNAYGIKGEYDRAIADYTQAIALDPKSAYAYIVRGSAYYFKGQKNQAIQDLEKALSLDPNDQGAKDALKIIRGW
jgi:tetratricopeptide (TPR) repeat protein